MSYHSSLRGILALCLLVCAPWVHANNIQVSNVTLTDQNTASDFTMVQFDISWENSWRLAGGPANWDAAWVFVKFRVGAGPWQHAWLNDIGHVAPTGSTVSIGLLDPAVPFNGASNPGMGAFIYRSGPGSGTFSLLSIKLRWNYGANGLDDNAQVDIKIFAIEHVYVPESAYYLGSGGAESGHFFQVPAPGDPEEPYLVSSESMIPIGLAPGNLYYDNASTYSGDRLGPIPGAFPKGFKAFYLMKYEISQKGYVDFLNTLTRSQQAGRVNADISGEGSANQFVLCNNTVPTGRNGVRNMGIYPAPPAPIDFYCDFTYDQLPDRPDDGLGIACGYLNLTDILAYLDWAGLRPITDLEFEKSARGPDLPTANEFAWGSLFYRGGYWIEQNGFPDEKPCLQQNICDPIVNCQYFGNVPLRCGAFAFAGSSREAAGAGYYGAMELSGNLWERIVSVGHPLGRLFDGRHGDGLLLVNGDPNTLNWPDLGSGEGSAFRGGSCNGIIDRLRTSDRFFGANPDLGTYPWTGGRGGRTAP